MAVAKNKVKRVAVETEPAPKTTRKSAELEKLMSDLNKKFGANCITLGVPKDEEGNIKSIERLSTGSIALDLALGGGIPEGRFIE